MVMRLGTPGLRALLACAVVLSTAGASVARDACPTGWREAFPARRLFGFTLTYDPVTNRSLLVGGNSDRTSQETWGWDGASWQVLERDGPLLMSIAAAMHQTSDRLIVFGGGEPTALLPTNDTWAYDGTSWELINFGVPPLARNEAAMSPDPLSGGIVLFGGEGVVNGQLHALNDTWLFDGTEWSQVNGAGPPARLEHAMATDTTRNVVVLFGGDDETNVRSDTWEWNGSGWTQRNVAGPQARRRHAMAFDAARGVVVLAGGEDGNGQLLSDTWEWNGTSWTQRPNGGLTGVSRHRMVYDAQRQRTVLLAGALTTTPGTAGVLMREYDGTTWTPVLTESPGGRANAAMAFDVTRSKTVLFGGAAVAGPDARTWLWDGSNWSIGATTGPSARQRQGMAWDSVRNVVVMYGGLTHNGRNALGDTWTWNGTAWTLASSGGPSARGEVGLAFDEARGVAVLFGGVNSDGDVLYADTWEWDGSAWTQRANLLPSARRSARLAFDRSRQKVVMYGGMDAGGPLTDAWDWNGTTWSPIAVSGGPPTQVQTLTDDFDLGGLVAIGVSPVNQQAQAWSFFGGQWRLCAENGPLPTAGAAAFDRARGELVFVSGTAQLTEPTETWRLKVAMAGDCNGDRFVNGADLAVLLSQFGQGPVIGAAADFNGDGLVSGADLSVLLSNFGSSCPVSN